MMVSWHNEKQPVSLSLLTPSLKTISLGSTLGLNRAGSSYQFFRAGSFHFFKPCMV
jgi:hypothetical protein